MNAVIYAPRRTPLPAWTGGRFKERENFFAVERDRKKKLSPTFFVP